MKRPPASLILSTRLLPRWREMMHICILFAKSCMRIQLALAVKNLPANAGGCKRHRFNPWVGKIPWRRARQPTAVFLPGESHGQRSLAGYSPQDCKESDTTKVT